MRGQVGAVPMANGVIHIQCEAVAAPLRCTGIHYHPRFLTKRQWLNLAEIRQVSFSVHLPNKKHFLDSTNAAGAICHWDNGGR